jgi:hypothetical protein
MTRLLPILSLNVVPKTTLERGATFTKSWFVELLDIFPYNVIWLAI